MKRITTDGETGPSFELPLENELLILKLKAEFGAECTSNTTDIPPDIVNEFLRSVYEFEQKFRDDRRYIRVYEKLRMPYFRKAEEIPDAQIADELRKMYALLNKHQLELDVLGEYPDRQIYKFITEEFLYHEMDDLELKGYKHHFCYEDFHPNYELEIRQRSVEFITQWFNRKLGEYSWQLADPFVHPDSREFSKGIVLKKIRYFFDAYTSFNDTIYTVADVKFEWNDEKQCGRAMVKGYVSYTATAEDGSVSLYEGPFEFYLSNSGTWWSIFYFMFPGFAW